MIEKRTLQYMVGGLLYMPAFQENMVEKILGRKIAGLTSVAFCLEDAIQDEALEDAEKNLGSILEEMRSAYEERREQLPLLFVRVRTPEHMRHISVFLGEAENVLTGYILPKFDISNGEAYRNVLREINRGRQEPLYVMPVLESSMIADNETRVPVLHGIKEILDSMKEFVLNVRVGGNDFSNLYGLRRPVDTPIYSVGVIRDILVDILNVFARDYVVSGPVWEYFDDKKGFDWLEGLLQELKLDRINGFIGKTAIHPSQLPHIYDSLKVSHTDYEDARQVLLWDVEKLGVVKSADGSRMNEVKTHRRWAERTKILGDIYGIRDEARLRDSYRATSRLHG
ncbi:MAG: HpcH/HpaI aldolase/citrate lyase family protein [Selenomonadaceae bacterium]|nr:HpcH/HpaI aldolase/citrate lyase family protein [Selenomonadaceae bacterium]